LPPRLRSVSLLDLLNSFPAKKLKCPVLNASARSSYR
jgi:hypothetical protein